jgi:hypothetical protein
LLRSHFTRTSLARPQGEQQIHYDDCRKEATTVLSTLQKPGGRSKSNDKMEFVVFGQRLDLSCAEDFILARRKWVMNPKFGL